MFGAKRSEFGRNSQIGRRNLKAFKEQPFWPLLFLADAPRKFYNVLERHVASRDQVGFMSVQSPPYRRRALFCMSLQAMLLSAQYYCTRNWNYQLRCVSVITNAHLQRSEERLYWGFEAPP
eukprot:3652647-Rhodomonas_salina.2